MTTELTIVVDTREQKPWKFSPRAATVKAALPAGDYSVAGLESEIAIERKSVEDLVNTLMHGKERFRAELAILVRYQYAAVVVEGSLIDIVRGQYRSGALPESLMGLIASICVDWRVPVFFAGSRGPAAALCERLLATAARRARAQAALDLTGGRNGPVR